MFNRLARGGRPYHLPRELLPDDVFLVSYPRSGSSWTRLLIANYITRGECSPDQLDNTLPDIHEDPSVADRVPSPRFIKSHVPFVPEYRRVVYLARDGRDIAVSYYYWHMRQGILPADTPFGEFLDRFNKGDVPFGSWSVHVDSWLDQAPGEFMVSRYEDEKEDPQGALLRIIEFAGLEADPDLAELAVSRSTMSTWRKAEARATELAPPEAGSGTSFARSGKVGQFEDLFTEKDMEEFVKVHGRALGKLGYIS